MKITMSFKEVAALAGIIKDVNEVIRPEDKKETIQEMMSKVMENFKEPDKHGFVTMKLDTSMNLVIEAEGEAVIRILELIKKYFVAIYPLLKLANETGMKMGQELQEIIDDYKEPEKEESPVHVTIVNVGPKNEDKDISKSAGHFEKMFKDMMENTEEMNRAAERPVSNHINRGPKSGRKKAFICPKCQHTAMIDPKKDCSCRLCGHEMERIFI